MDTFAHYTAWRGLLRLGGWAAFGSVALLVVQVVVLALWPPLDTVLEIYALMERSPVLGLVSLDVLYLVNNVLVLLFYLGLAVVLWQVSRSGTTVAVVLGTLQMAALYASNPAVEMMLLARQDGATTDPALHPVYRAAGEAVLSAWKGTAFLVYYFLGAAVLLVFAALIRRSPEFGTATFWWAVTAGVLMLVPSTFGVVGMVFALASLLPWSVLCVLAGRRLLHLARTQPRPPQAPVSVEAAGVGTV